MTRLYQSVATLRITGDLLKPEEITRLLAAEPTSSYAKGQGWQSQQNGETYSKRSGSWSLKTDTCEPGNLDEQVKHLLGKLTGELGVWTSIRQSFGINLFCGFFMNETNEGICVLPETLLALGERGIELQLDIYAPEVGI